MGIWTISREIGLSFVSLIFVEGVNEALETALRDLTEGGISG